MGEALDGFIVARKDGSLHCVSVDREDYARVDAAGPWQVLRGRNTCYMTRHVWSAGKRTSEYLHRFIFDLGFGDDRQVDHIDGNGLNNTRHNLRVVTRLEQTQNMPLRDSSRFRGVSLHIRRGKWQAHVQHKGVQHYFGIFASEADAARAAAEGRALLFTHAVEARHPVPSIKERE